jgi:uncharacterized DUF497 family protein
MHKRAYTNNVGFEWNPRKARANLAKHEVSFADAVAVLEDPLALTVHDEEAAEERFVTVGTDDTGRLLVVVYAWRDDSCIRIISARGATRRERQQYEGGE